MRAGGILMSVTSLPSAYGIGCFSKEAYRFDDWLKEAGQAYWQILPVGPTGYGDSPYQPFSAFAGNPYMIDPETLAEQGLLTEEELRSADFGDDETSVDYEKLYRNRSALLKQAWKRSAVENDPAYRAFCEEQAFWLDDYCLFRAVKERFSEKSWDLWDEDIRTRRPDAVEAWTRACAEEIAFGKYLQYTFMQQWKSLRSYANSKGIRIIGDIPIYVAFDGADSWAMPELFQFDVDRRPVMAAGCPPVAFAADGQLWGNPLYDWPYHAKTGYSWWKKRLQRCFELYDIVRVDHFRGFDEYYAIPFGAATAAGGHWCKGPGMDFFRAVREQFGQASVIAEDLGYVTDSVVKLVRESGYPGMKVIEFAFDSREAGDYMPYTYDHHCVVYTGTHDNQTLAAWYDELTDRDREVLDEYLDLQGKTREEIVWALIRLTLSCVADTAIIPMQDYLCLGSEARMNRPSSIGKNWRWRIKPDALSAGLAKKIGRLFDVYGRTGTGRAE